MPDASDTALRVALPVPLPQLFDYLPPDGTMPDPDWIGRRVRVRFGRGEREQVGIVVDLVATRPELKRAEACLDDAPLLAGELFDSLRWVAGYYHAPLGEVLATALPAALRAGQPLPDTGRHGWRLTGAGDAAAGRGDCCWRWPRARSTRTRSSVAIRTGASRCAPWPGAAWSSGCPGLACPPARPAPARY
jgi:primosomal protein N' (replication factor Y)